MELKKNPKYDIHEKRNVIFYFSLACSIVIVTTAFEWKAPITYSKPPQPKPKTEDIIIILPTDQVYEMRKPKPIPLVNPFSYVEIKNNQTPIAHNSPEDVPEIVDKSTEFREPQIDLPREETTEPFRWVEKMPEPVNGYEGFYKQLSRNLKYPLKARENGTQGKVFVEFIINEQGELSNIKTSKGIGDGCDEEAMRVLAMTKWNAGKQRGRPVKVRMILPIYFSLN